MLGLFFLFSLFAKIFISCPLESKQVLLSMECIQYVDCSTSNSVNYMLFQHCNTSWFQTNFENTGLLTKSNKKGFTTNDKLAKNFKIGQRCALINFDNAQLYFYQMNSNKYSHKLQNINSFLDYQLQQSSNSTFGLILLNTLQLTTLQFDFKLKPIKQKVYNFTSIVRLIRHISAQLYVIGTQNGDILIFNTSKHQIVTTYANKNGSILQIQPKVINESADFYKIYVYFDSKILCEYVLIGSTLYLQRTSHYFNHTLFLIQSYLNNDYLLISDISGNISLVDLNNGTLIDTTNLNQKLPKKQNTSLYVLFNDKTSYFIVNSFNNLVLQSIISINMTGNVVLKCKNLYYYNSQISRCTLGIQACGQCSQNDVSYKKCNNGFFNNNGECISCFYNEQAVTQNFKQCFTVMEMQLIQKSGLVVNVFSEMLSKLTIFLNMCGLLFVFLKLINNWSLICLYFFVNIQVPFFLQNILFLMFKQINRSIFQTIGINLNPSLNINYQLENKKLSAAEFSLDFVALNYQSLILFFYSVFFLLTLYRFIDYCLYKIGMSLFNQKNIVYMCDEFVGIFGNTLVPLSYILLNAQITDPRSKLNFMLHALFAGLILVSPVIFLLFREQPKYKYKINKVRNQNQIQIAQAIQKRFTAKKALFRQNQCFQKYLYALLTFSIALLANSHQPRIFFYVVGCVHIANIWNSCIDRPVKVNHIIQNLQFATFHVCFSLLYYIGSQVVKFNISIGLVILIILIALHQMLTSLITKIYFIYSLFRTYLERKQQIQIFFAQNKTNNHAFESRMHAAKIQISKMSSKTILNCSKQSYRIIFQEKKKNKQLPIQPYPNRQREIQQLKYLQKKGEKKRFGRISHNTDLT